LAQGSSITMALRITRRMFRAGEDSKAVCDQVMPLLDVDGEVQQQSELIRCINYELLRAHPDESVLLTENGVRFNAVKKKELNYVRNLATSQNDYECVVCQLPAKLPAQGQFWRTLPTKVADALDMPAEPVCPKCFDKLKALGCETIRFIEWKHRIVATHYIQQTFDFHHKAVSDESDLQKWVKSIVQVRWEAEKLHQRFAALCASGGRPLAVRPLVVQQQQVVKQELVATRPIEPVFVLGDLGNVLSLHSRIQQETTIDWSRLDAALQWLGGRHSVWFCHRKRTLEMEQSQPLQDIRKRLLESDAIVEVQDDIDVDRAILAAFADFPALRPVVLSNDKYRQYAQLIELIGRQRHADGNWLEQRSIRFRADGPFAPAGESALQAPALLMRKPDEDLRGLRILLDAEDLLNARKTLGVEMDIDALSGALDYFLGKCASVITMVWLPQFESHPNQESLQFIRRLLEARIPGVVALDASSGAIRKELILRQWQKYSNQFQEKVWVVTNRKFQSDYSRGDTREKYTRLRDALFRYVIIKGVFVPIGERSTPQFSQGARLQPECKMPPRNTAAAQVQCTMCLQKLPEWQLQSHLDTCDYRAVGCVYCGKLIAAMTKGEHEHTCPKRIVKCELCSMRMEHSRLLTHSELCRDAEVRDGSDPLSLMAASSATRSRSRSPRGAPRLPHM